MSRKPKVVNVDVSGCGATHPGSEGGCVLSVGHDGDHRDKGGGTWPEPFAVCEAPVGGGWMCVLAKGHSGPCSGMLPPKNQACGHVGPPDTADITEPIRRCVLPTGHTGLHCDDHVDPVRRYHWADDWREKVAKTNTLIRELNDKLQARRGYPPPPQQVRPACGSCKFRDGFFCRRNPPTLVQGYAAGKWPTVQTDDWCGEYQIEPYGVAHGDARAGLLISADHGAPSAPGASAPQAGGGASSPTPGPGATGAGAGPGDLVGWEETNR